MCSRKVNIACVRLWLPGIRCIQIAVNNNQRCTCMKRDPSPHYDGCATPTITFQHAGVLETFTTLSPHTLSSILAIHTNPRLVRKKDASPSSQCPSLVRLGSRCSSISVCCIPDRASEWDATSQPSFTQTTTNIVANLSRI